MKTNNDLQEIIRAALDCRTHFVKPTIINNDRDFSFGDNPIVICSTCVDRMRKAIGLRENECVPTGAEFKERRRKKGINTK